MNKRIAGVLATGAVLAGTVGGLTACSSASSSPNATQVLQSDGYTPSAAYTSSLQSGLDGGNGEVTSSQAGTNSAGDIQGVVVFDNAADATTGEQGINSAFGGDGISVATNGDVLTATGPLTAWAAAGGGS